MAETKTTTPQPKKRNGLIVTAVVIVVLVVAGVGFYQWHETPQFCAAICHNMDQYLTTYEAKQGAETVDKYGNVVTDSNAMMATLHRKNDTTAMSEIRCMGCHHPILAEQVSEGFAFIAGNYYDPLYERVGNDLTHWWGNNVNGTQFCVNENCHVYLRGNDGNVDPAKLEKTTIDMAFNPHSTHHGDATALQCTECHKGHRASVVVCSGCHNSSNPDIPAAELPDGWITYSQDQQIMEKAYKK